METGERKLPESRKGNTGARKGGRKKGAKRVKNTNEEHAKHACRKKKSTALYINRTIP